jgi:flagellar basal-body rod protein FlgB
MEIKALFDDTIHLAEKALNMRSRRHDMILSNIANADTPNYKAFDLLVDEALARQAPQDGSIQMTKTDPAHFGANGSQADMPEVRMVDVSPQVSLRGDGNTVDMDREMGALSENELQYKATTQILAKKFLRIRNMIQGGKS